MYKPAPSHAAKARTLAQQEGDFTSEGSPPPGKVGATTPLSQTEAPPDQPSPTPRGKRVKAKPPGAHR